MTAKRRPERAHRLLWVEVNGPIAAGDDVHHACEDKRCVRIDHLRLLEHSGHAAEHVALNPEGQRRRSRYAMHVRWHVNRDRLGAECEWCSK